MQSQPLDDFDDGFSLSDILQLVWRRRYWILIPFVLSSVAAVAVAFLMPPVYRSSATILIESQQVPTEFVSVGSTSFADERIAKIRQQLLSRPVLFDLVRRNELYADDRKSKPLTKVIEGMRSSIAVDLISANLQGGRRGGAAIAFTLGFEYDDPAKAQRVADQLTTMFLETDQQNRTERAEGTANFLARRAAELREELSALQVKMTNAKSQFNGALPEQAMINQMTVSSLRGELSRIDGEVQALYRENTILAARASTMARMQREGGRINELAQARADLASAEAIYSDSHPDVRALRDRVASLEASSSVERPTERAILEPEVQAQIDGNRSRIEVLGRRRGEILSEMNRLEAQLMESPRASVELGQLQRDYDNVSSQYEGIRSKLTEAQVSASMETEQKGEKFTILDPASVPEQPIRPNRPVIMVLGVLGGLGFGLALALALELLHRPVRGARAVAKIVGHAPLALIPIMQPGEDGHHALMGNKMQNWLRQKRKPAGKRVRKNETAEVEA
jgi:polysaccharide biosynthesis transport protein